MDDFVCAVLSFRFQVLIVILGEIRWSFFIFCLSRAIEDKEIRNKMEICFSCWIHSSFQYAEFEISTTKKLPN